MSQIKLFLILSLFSFTFSQICIIGKNCPFNQGFCLSDTCECLDGYKTLYNPKLAVDQQIYCNYKQINHLIPLILELFFPGIGHFYVGKYWFGLIKLILALVFLGLCYYIYSEMKIPSYFETFRKMLLNKFIDDDILRCYNRNEIKFEIIHFCFKIDFYIFLIFWAFDLYMYFTKTYYDGNGIPLY